MHRDLDLPRRSLLTGTVTSATSGHAVAEATATLVDEHGTVVGSTVTGPDGAFVFEDLAEGTYTLTASGYPPVGQLVQVMAGTSAMVTVVLGAADGLPARAYASFATTADGPDLG
ncbi:carboxypeptidase-like regulatory domain-containing protein [Pseudonocardia bannensis]|uniref:carboxypeptidase-like regulatory domain-containing protein n=1 Tax=Pseudonocardia bannensis TaxID=630973 RepID=UPI0028A60443|nr:carboxypeptidase-like regulatory domain-containing protein [Pseudonocardia bannensis]